jgi:hypothetical protein
MHFYGALAMGWQLFPSLINFTFSRMAKLLNFINQNEAAHATSNRFPQV